MTKEGLVLGNAAKTAKNIAPDKQIFRLTDMK